MKPGRRLTLGSALAVGVLLVACAGPAEPVQGAVDEPPAGEVPEEGVGPEGGEVTSDDGTAVLTIPPGALSEVVVIDIEAIPIVAEDLDIDGDIEVVASYGMTPDGLELDEPGTLEVTLPPPTADTPPETMVGIYRGWPDIGPLGVGADVVATGEETTATVPVERLGDVVIFPVQGSPTITATGQTTDGPVSLELVPSFIDVIVGSRFEMISRPLGLDVGSPDYGPVSLSVAAHEVLPSEGVLELTPGPPGANPSDVAIGIYRCTAPGTGVYGATARFALTFPSPVSSAGDEATVTVRGVATCRNRTEASPPQFGRLPLDIDSTQTTVEAADGTTSTAPATAEELAAAAGLPTEYALMVDEIGQQLVVLIGPGVEDGGPPPACYTATVGTGPDDSERIAVETAPGACPAFTADEGTTLLVPACATASPERTVVAFPWPDRTDGLLIVSAGQRIADDRLVAVGANAGPVDALAPFDSGVAASSLCALADEAAAAGPPPEAEPPEEAGPPATVDCVVARFDDTGRLPSFPATVLLFVRGQQPFSAANGVIAGVNRDVEINGYPDQSGWWIEGGVPGPGSYRIQTVTVTTAAGAVDVTQEVVSLLGGDVVEATATGIVSPESSCDPG